MLEDIDEDFEEKTVRRKPVPMTFGNRNPRNIHYGNTAQFQPKPMEDDRFYEQNIVKAGFRPNRNVVVSTTEDIPVVSRKSRTGQQMVVAAPVKKRKLSVHPLGYLGAGMLLAAFLVWGLFSFSSWWQIHQDDVTYGTPRTYQVDQAVGHNGDSANKPSHFIFENNQGQVVVIEFPAGDAGKTIVYNGPQLYGQNVNLLVVKGIFQDVNHDGKLDMIISVEGQSKPVIYLNDGSKFQKQ